MNFEEVVNHVHSETDYDIGLVKEIIACACDYMANNCEDMSDLTDVVRTAYYDPFQD